MQHKIIIAGFGGQGVVLAANLLAKACIIENKNVTTMVAYGVEMRGGAANSTVVISDEEIASPVVENPDIAIILNSQSLDVFENSIKKSGLIILNSSLAEREPRRKDIKIEKIPATEIADKIGNTKVANLVALGYLIKKTNILKIDSLNKAIEEIFSNKQELIAINKKSIQEGINHQN